MKNKALGGVVLIVVGVLLLLANLDYLSFNIFFSIINLWPLILIGIGVNIIFKNKKIVSYISWGLIITIMLIYGIYTQGGTSSSIKVNDNIVIEKHPETKYGELNLEIGASKINIDSTSQNLLSADISGRQVNYRSDYKNNYEIAIIDIESRTYRTSRPQNFNSVYDFYLNEDLVWDLDFDLGAVSAQINLEDIPVRNIDLNSGAADLVFILGNKHDLDIDIDTGASSISFIFPEEAGLSIKMDMALSDTNIHDLALIHRGEYYMSENYDDADIVINLDIDMGLGSIDFSYR